MLIQEGAIVDSFSLDYGTPLIVALWIGNEAVVRLLIEKGANIIFNKDEHFGLCSSWTFIPFGFRPPGTCPASEIFFSARTIVQQRRATIREKHEATVILALKCQYKPECRPECWYKTKIVCRLHSYPLDDGFVLELSL
jgi:hypothetical protein